MAEIFQEEQIIHKIKRKFTIGELSGSLGDWGTLIPFIIGYVSIVRLNPAGIFLCLGLTNIILGIKYNLPLPIEPQKTIGTIALANKWTPSLVISTGFGTGIVWAILGFSKKINYIIKKVPTITVRGIQLGLGLILGWAALLLFSTNYLLGFISVGIILVLMKFKWNPSAIILVFLGIFLILITNLVSTNDIAFNMPYFDFYLPNWENLLIGMVAAGIAQLFLTLTNVMIATTALIKDFFPDQANKVNANTLADNMGVINLFSPFLGGIPLCHGSGGFAAQYAFGARTGGSMIMEGTIELFLGLFFSQTLFMMFSNFPQAILGAMLLYTAFLLGRVSTKDFEIKKFMIILLSGLLCFLINIIVGFILGFILGLIYKKIEEGKIVIPGNENKIKGLNQN